MIYRANDIPFSPKTGKRNGIWGLKRNFQLAHQLQKFVFCESEMIPQVVKLKSVTIKRLHTMQVLF